MKHHKTLTRTLIAAAILASASAAQALSVEASVDAATQAVTDTTLTGAVKAKLATDKRVDGSDISVTTENGVVILSGTAPSAEAKAAAEKIAKNAEGTVKVENRIEAPGVLANLGSDAKEAVDDTGEAITDAWITTKVKTQLLANDETKGSAMKVETKDNVVYLSGTVASSAEKAKAIKVAKETKGVNHVDAKKLKVSSKLSLDAKASTRTQ